MLKRPFKGHLVKVPEFRALINWSFVDRKLILIYSFRTGSDRVGSKYKISKRRKWIQRETKNQKTSNRRKSTSCIRKGSQNTTRNVTYLMKFQRIESNVDCPRGLSWTVWRYESGQSEGTKVDGPEGFNWIVLTQMTVHFWTKPTWLCTLDLSHLRYLALPLKMRKWADKRISHEKANFTLTASISNNYQLMILLKMKAKNLLPSWSVLVSNI